MSGHFGQAGRTFVIGEVALSHDGSLGLAHAFIDAIAAAGADAVKFQTHIAAAESTPSEPFRVKFSTQDATRYQYWQRMEFTEPQWQELATHAQRAGMVFMSSPFSVEAVELLERLDMALWKIGSGEVSNDPMLDRIADIGKPILLSSGMSAMAELDRVIARLKRRDVELGVLQCTTAYPCPPEKIGLNLLDVFRQRYDCLTGLSDHSATIYPSLAAAALGADVVEVHVTLSREMFGPDVVASLTTTELRQMVDGIRFIERMKANPVDKDLIAHDMAGLRAIFNKSIVARVALEPGTVLGAEHLTVKKPGTGLAAARLPELVGRRIKRRVAADALLAEEDLEGAESA
ncbi:MAG TPA: N-acetylneuraminate synthase family protein [Vicinamibacterales bacterium]|nr:N-acetylneuraminate synthase family protein [Vicinamibacterales bacterium]